VSNGGIASDEAIEAQLNEVDGAMIGRHAYHHPWAMTGWDAHFFGADPQTSDRDAIEATMVDYMERVARTGEPWTHVSRHILGLRHGEPGARRWRQVWSDPSIRALGPREVSRRARAAAVASPREPAELGA